MLEPRQSSSALMNDSMQQVKPAHQMQPSLGPEDIFMGTLPGLCIILHA